MKVDHRELQVRLKKAALLFWQARIQQATSQKSRGTRDQGSRGAVIGGTQMDGFIRLISDLITEAGLPETCIHRNAELELPGYFRPTKKWDLVAVSNRELVAAIEAKSQVGPSFGNNFNNRTEEALGSAADIWTAYREGAFGCSPRPWIGYLFLLEDSPKSRSPVSVAEPHFEVFPEFRNASYVKRYEILCRKLVRERHYESAAFLTSPNPSGKVVTINESAEDLAFVRFAASLVAHISAFGTMSGDRS